MHVVQKVFWLLIKGL